MKAGCVKESNLEVTRSGSGQGGKGKKKHSRSRPQPYNVARFDRNVGAEEKDQAEITAYLDKLQELVPFMPKNKRLSKLTVISHVIEYIRELRVTLGLPPSCSNSSAFPDFTEIDMNNINLSPPPSPVPTSVTLTMTMLPTVDPTGGMLDRAPPSDTTSCSAIAELVSTSLSGVSVSPAAVVPSAISCTATAAKQQQQQQGRQPLGIILNPRNCATTTNTSSSSAIPSSSQVFQKSPAQLPPSSGDKN